jgi:putative ABC transport system ATP-binding protein
MFGSSLKRNGAPAPDEGFGDSNRHIVDLHKVVKTYDSAAGTFTALKGIDLQVGAGRFVSIIGKSGSGKSTLINMITGIDRPTAGQVLVDNTPVHVLDEEQLATWRGRSIGVIFQFFQLLPTLTAVENVLLPMDYCRRYPPRERPERAMYLLEQVGMADYAHKLPSELSGGQQQSIAIARALACDPSVLAADEPTGNLDSRTAGAILRLFENLVDGGKTILMVTHDNDLAARAQSTVVLADGQIVDEKGNR